MLNLLEKQKVFSKTLAKFLNDLFLRGYDVTMGECYRPPEMADIYASQGRGVKNSNHCIKLAVDLNIFYQGTFLTSKEILEIPGKLWKVTQLALCKLAGVEILKMLTRNHFSFLHNGVK
jgi:hypothetical protein